MDKKERWHDNNILVVILLILIFPLGLYALYKNRSLSSSSKLIIAFASIIFLIFVATTDKKIDSVTNQEQLDNNSQIDKKVAKETTKKDKKNNKINRNSFPTTGIKYSQMLNQIKDQFDLQYSIIELGDYKGYPKASAYNSKKSELMSISLIGNEDNIIKAFMTTTLSETTEKLKALQEYHVSLLMQFLQNTDPTWERVDIANWSIDALKMFESGKQKVSTLRGDNKVTLSQSEMIITAEVNHKDFNKEIYNEIVESKAHIKSKLPFTKVIEPQEKIYLKRFINFYIYHEGFLNKMNYHFFALLNEKRYNYRYVEGWIYSLSTSQANFDKSTQPFESIDPPDSLKTYHELYISELKDTLSMMDVVITNLQFMDPLNYRDERKFKNLLRTLRYTIQDFPSRADKKFFVKINELFQSNIMNELYADAIEARKSKNTSKSQNSSSKTNTKTKDNKPKKYCKWVDSNGVTHIESGERCAD